MTEDELKQRLWRALFDQLGGPETIAMLNQWADGDTLEAIANRHGVQKSTVSKRICKVRGALSSYGLLPKKWTTRRRVSDSRNKCNK